MNAKRRQTLWVVELCIDDFPEMIYAVQQMKCVQSVDR